MSKSAVKVSQNSGQQATPLLDKLQSLSDKIIRLANNTEQKKGNLPEFFRIYTVVGHILCDIGAP